MLEIIEGNILDCPADECICHQCYCVTGYKVAGIAWEIYNRYPWAYPSNRIFNEMKLGSVDIRFSGYKNRCVINMYAQFYPGPPRGRDTALLREKGFLRCLEKMGEFKLTTFAFPYKIGCGLARGNWEHYYTMLENFSKTGKIVKIYKLEGEK
jgi:O-acetyl-ADP-ribose deacetylase (regulator of RNase III)